MLNKEGAVVDTIFCLTSIRMSKQREEKKMVQKKKKVLKTKREKIERWIKKSQLLKNSFYKKSDQNPN